MEDLNNSDFASCFFIYNSLESWYVYTTFTCVGLISMFKCCAESDNESGDESSNSKRGCDGNVDQ